MIRLTCPNCSASLEIDPGFAGGICRCYNCGTLMTVPKDPDHHSPETVQRSERPDRPDSPEGGGAPDATYVTASGQQLSLSGRQLDRVPTARRRRMGVRVVIIGLFLLMVIAVVAVMATLMMQVVEDSKPPAPEQIANQAMGYDPQANPYDLTTPNIAGLPARSGKLVVVIDASASMNRHLDFIKEMIPLNLATLTESTSVQVIYAADGGAVAIPDQPTAAPQVNIEGMRQKQAEVWPGGAGAIVAAFDQAFAAAPDAVVFIAAAAPSHDVLTVIEEGLDRTNAKFDVVMIGNPDSVLTALTKASRGRAVDLPAGQIEQWWQRYSQGR